VRDSAATIHVVAASQVLKCCVFPHATLVSSLAQLCDARAEVGFDAETFRRMPRSDHRNSLVDMGTHPRNDDQ
jgi:hypothetical protein